MLWPPSPASVALGPQQEDKVMPVCTVPQGACWDTGPVAGEGVTTLGFLIGWIGFLGHVYRLEEELGTCF